MIKVLRIINRFNLGGPTYNVTFLSKFMDDEFETELWGGQIGENEGGALFIPNKYGVETNIVQHMERELNFQKDGMALREIREIIRKFKPDIVHTHASKAGALGRYAAIKEKVPIIVHTFHGHVFHNYFGKTKTEIYKRVERYLAKKSDAIIAISPLQKQELVGVYNISSSEKVSVIPLGFDLENFSCNKVGKRKVFRDKYAFPENEMVVGLVGRMVPVKNHLGFLQSIDLVAAKANQKLSVCFIGDGEMRAAIEQEAKMLEEKHLNLRVVFTSWVKNVAESLPGLDVVCLSSLNEGTPVSLIEAQAAGVPVITTDVGGVRDVVVDGVTGVVVGEFTPEKYADSLLKLMKDKEIRQKMSQNGWNNVKDKFHYERLCADMGDLYRNLLAKKKLK